MHHTADPEQNPDGLPVFDEGKIFTAHQGGRYNIENIIPESRTYNGTRGNKTVRKENTE